METQVAIVGGGPVGLGLAIELGQRGIDTVVVEKAAEMHSIPKGQNLTQRTMEHFRFWGVEDQVRAARVMPPDYPAAGVNAYGNLLSRFAHPWFRRSDVDQYYFARSERLPQYITERILRRRVNDLPVVTTRYGVAAESVRSTERNAFVGTTGGDIVAQYVVGCDGSRSLVRRQAGITETRSDHDRRMVLLVFRSRELQRILEERFGKVAFFNVLDPSLDGYWRFLGTVDTLERWFFHAPVSADSTADNLDYKALLHESVGTVFPVELDHIGFWDLRIATADSYRAGRVFIAGDAAHSHPPYGGYGINTGFEDARNLGWKLAAELQGWSGAALLDSYTVERRAVFLSTARDFIGAFIENDRAFIQANDPTVDEVGFGVAWKERQAGSGRAVNVFAPHYEGSPLVFGPPGGASSAVGVHDFEARPGHRLPPRRLRSGDDLFAALGTGFALIGGGPAAAPFEAAAGGLRVPLALVPADFADERGSYGSPLVLVRPDHYVCWAGTGEPDNAATVIGRAIGSRPASLVGGAPT